MWPLILPDSTVGPISHINPVTLMFHGTLLFTKLTGDVWSKHLAKPSVLFNLSTASQNVLSILPFHVVTVWISLSILVRNTSVSWGGLNLKYLLNVTFTKHPILFGNRVVDDNSNWGRKTTSLWSFIPFKDVNSNPNCVLNICSQHSTAIINRFKYMATDGLLCSEDSVICVITAVGSCWPVTSKT